MLELSVRQKIILVVVSLSLVILAFGAYVSYVSHQDASGRGRYLNTHFIRFRSALETSGAGDLTAAATMARDPELVSVLAPSAPPPPAEVAQPTGDEDADEGAAAAGRAPAGPAGGSAEVDRAKLDETLERLTDTIEHALDPELIVLLDASGDPIPGPGLTKLPPTAFRQSRLALDVRSSLIRSAYAVIDGRPYLVAGAPVLAPGAKRRVLGAVLVGRSLQTFFEKYAPASGSDKPEKQHRVSFVRTDGSVLASALPNEEWTPLGKEWAKGADNYRMAPEGEDMVPVLDVGPATYDFYDGEVSGYDGMQSPESPIGSLALVRSRDHKKEELRDKLWELAWTFGAAGLLSVLVGLALAGHITRRINGFTAATDDLAAGRGDLTQRIEITSKDELGRLAMNLNRVFEQIQTLTNQVQGTALRVGDSSAELSTSSRSMLDGAKTQKVKIENSTAAVTELSASIQQVAENANEATKVAHKTGAAVQDAIARLSQIRQTVDDAGMRIEQLGESGKRIGSIVEVIRHISEQTTLLALNAAIEAAHAGDQGRGFAVVADEVSNLAKRVGRSAKDIEDLIETIRDQTGEAVRAMQVGTREVEEGTHLVTNTLADLQTIIGAVEDTAAAVGEQAIASDEIARNMDAVRAIAGDVLSASERAVSAGDDLSRLADQLEESVKGFKIIRDASEAPAVPVAKRLPPAV
jgi:methyl-accepting chemotaxis protein